jgi:hypothetical protein
MKWGKLTRTRTRIDGWGVQRDGYDIELRADGNHWVKLHLNDWSLVQLALQAQDILDDKEKVARDYAKRARRPKP